MALKATLRTLLFLCILTFSAKNDFARSGNPEPEAKPITWTPDRKLSWNDFRGPVPGDASDREAAITSCGIGYATSFDGTTVSVEVYNEFYTTESWVRPGCNHDYVLTHEQGHFDLCELYTRILRQRIASAHLAGPQLKAKLRLLYDDLQEEYNRRQLQYEAETQHGILEKEQARWQSQIAVELRAIGSSSNVALR